VGFPNRVLDLRQDGRLRIYGDVQESREAAGATLEHTHSQLIALPVFPRSSRKRSTARDPISNTKSAASSATSFSRSCERTRGW
jgi:galactose-1-phosphate uridylyltransferase